MCGIFGVISDQTEAKNTEILKLLIDSLFILSESRGKEAAGIALLSGSTISVYKEPVRGTEFLKKCTFSSIMNSVLEEKSKDTPIAAIGHSRLATNGPQTENENNQPVIAGNMVGIHNGIIVNDKHLWTNILQKKPSYDVDTEVVLVLLRRYLSSSKNIEQATSQMYSAIEGSASLAILFSDLPGVLLSTNTGSLYYTVLRHSRYIIFASEQFILQELLSKHAITDDRIEVPVTQIYPRSALFINLFNCTIKPFTFTKVVKKTSGQILKKTFDIKEHQPEKRIGLKHASILYFTRSNDINKINKHVPNYKAIYSLKRCLRCILPETMPFIEFDEKGVCNYCKNHEKITYRGKTALEKLVAPYRSGNRKPDCILAFSGGRDSSYGLHFLKKELGMNPIAYTYDWGMVTDLARRNEARMVGKLGIEHITVSADIRMKRDHIRKHILAWMKKPDLGMVPLFMEGDKQCEYYANELAKKTGIKLIFYTRGNELEIEEFKWGHCGIRKATPNGVIHNLSLQGKIQILSYYAGQYITNLAYINSSLFDTLFAYFSTYVMKHSYIYLWHYIPWKEKEIVSTLRSQYNWETEPGTAQTWRTDDGTSSFYNYIYYIGQGFTENDTFRSNQIREGLLDRKTALALVYEENKPRHQALKWYFDMVGLDGDIVLTAVDAMPTLYA